MEWTVRKYQTEDAQSIWELNTKELGYVFSLKRRRKN